VRISRVKVGNRQAPHAATKNPTPKRWGFLLPGTILDTQKTNQKEHISECFQNYLNNQSSSISINWQP
ncbi:hypothetical protein, partial [Caballeronia sp. LZ024]|uniref:hypothetical protein n=1 Tax=Caballeronia sp. LZ024 TaxID=3038561 RepID=UPI0028626B79